MDDMIACAPVDGSRHGLPRYVPPGPGYLQERCPTCGELMWVGLRSRDLRERTGIPAVCMVCALRATGGDHEVVSLGGK